MKTITKTAHIKNNLYEMDIEYNIEPIKARQHILSGLGIWYYDSIQNRISQWEVQEHSGTNLYADSYKNNYHLVVASSKPLWRWWVHKDDYTWNWKDVSHIPSLPQIVI